MQKKANKQNLERQSLEGKQENALQERTHYVVLDIGQLEAMIRIAKRRSPENIKSKSACISLDFKEAKGFDVDGVEQLQLSLACQKEVWEAKNHGN